MLKIKHFLSEVLNGKYSHFLWLFPVVKNKIVICNFYGGGYGDNLKYISEKLLDKQKDLDIVWLVKNETMIDEFPESIRIVKYRSLKGLYELATSRIWIDNARKFFYPPKRKNQFYIQTWHGGIALKKIEKDVEEILNKQYLKYAKKDSEIADFFISNSKFCTDMYNSAFWGVNKVLEFGSPRCDVLIENSIVVDKVKKEIGVYNEKIILYAPTFRDDGNLNYLNLDFNEIINNFEQKYGVGCKLLIRLHPNVRDSSRYITTSDKIIDVTNYSDMYELMAITDILITDYSSTMFEFAITKKPIFLYTPDLEIYKKNRDFYFNIVDLPFNLALTEPELIKKIKDLDNEGVCKNTEKFLDKLQIFDDGLASERTASFILELTK